MRIYAYQAPRGNLGDDLNHWLWPRLLNPTYLSRPGVFMGIGSVIHPDHLQQVSAEQQLVIFGAGCRSARDPFENLDLTPNIAMVRGPLSARSLGIDESKAILDAAYAIQFTDEYTRWITLPKKHNITLIPYFRSGPLVQYSVVKALKNWNILRSDQYGSIDAALTTIASSRLILTESLHGAILADALRVPWMRVWYYLDRPTDRETGEFKWRDWQASLNIPHIPTLRIPLPYQYWISGRKSLLLKPWRTVQYLRHLKIKESFVLSPEPHWVRSTERLQEELKILQG